MNKKERSFTMLLMPIIFAVGIAGGLLMGKYFFSSYTSPQEAKLHAILKMINEEYVDEVNIDSVFEQLYPKMLSLLDPHSAYIPASDLQAVNDDLEASFSGVGVSFQIFNDTVSIVEIVAGGPAEKVGLVAGDKILKADTIDLTGKNATQEKVFKTLRGEKGSKVQLEILRSNSVKPLKYEIIRGEVPVHSVDVVYPLNDSIGYIRVSKFARSTAEEFREALIKLSFEGVSKFVVDLRGNSGGYLDQAIVMAQEFLPEGRMIVYTKGKMPEYQSLAGTDKDGRFARNEIVVLTDEYSASASEVFAGAIQDNDRGLIIGRRTFGKGLVQIQNLLPDSSAIRLTIARYYTPSGRSIQKDYKSGDYDLDLSRRFAHGEFYNADSIRFDKSKMFTTLSGRKVFGGGGIMPDLFVPEDTLGLTTYYIQVSNAGLIRNYANKVANNYREILSKTKNIDQFKKVLPRDNTLLEGFVEYAVSQGVPARWYYINKSKNLILNQIKAIIARDVIGYEAFVEMLNENDPTIERAMKALMEGESPVFLSAPPEAEKKK